MWQPERGWCQTRYMPKLLDYREMRRRQCSKIVHDDELLLRQWALERIFYLGTTFGVHHHCPYFTFGRASASGQLATGSRL